MVRMVGPQNHGRMLQSRDGGVTNRQIHLNSHASILAARFRTAEEKG
jgi:hypothetical protein